MSEKPSVVVETQGEGWGEDIVNEVHGLAHPFVYVVVLQLNEASADGGDVALLIGEGHAAGSLRIFELRVGVDASVANASVEPVHDHSQLHLRAEGENKRKRRLVQQPMLSAVKDSFYLSVALELKMKFCDSLL